MRSVAVLTLAWLMTACGIDRGGAPTQSPPVDLANSDDLLLAGPISGLSNGVLTIDDISIDVASALVRVEGAASQLDLLEVGQYAVVRGVTSAVGSVGQEIDVDTEVLGTADAFDNVTNTLNLLGQQVALVSSTVIADDLPTVDFSDTAGLGPIRVSGIADGTGRITATYIAPAPMTTFRLTGFAADVNEANFSFVIGAQPISYASAVTINLTASTPSQNSRVTLTGALDGTVFSVEEINDAALLPEDLRDDAVIWLTAAVTGELNTQTFEVAFVPADLAPNITITDGAASDITPGTIVALRGRWTADDRIAVAELRIVPSQ